MPKNDIELRKDYILDRYVIIAKGRAKRPVVFNERDIKKTLAKSCFFCKGHEDETPPEIGRVEQKDSWIIRWFPNKFPFISVDNKAKKENKKFLFMTPGLGYHEVIAETPKHDEQLWDQSAERIMLLLKVYALRILELSEKKEVKYVAIFKNHGKDAAASLEHSHSQVVTTPIVPELVEEKLKAVKKHKRCPYCDIIKKESKSKRKIFENKNFIAFAPYASAFKYQVAIMPKKHYKSITEMDDDVLLDLAKIYQKVLLKLRSINASYNMMMHYSPKGKNLHFQMEILPRLSKRAGFEFNTGIVINPVSPEDAAKFYKSKN